MSPNLAAVRPSHASRVKPKKPSIIIPATPINARNPSFSHQAYNQPSQLLLRSPSVYAYGHTPLQKPAPDANVAEDSTAEKTVSTKLIAVAELFAALKCTLTTLNTTFDGLGEHAEKLTSLGPNTKTVEQINDVRAELDNQIVRQEISIKQTRHLLRTFIRDSLIDHLKNQIYNEIQETIAANVKDRVQRELELQTRTLLSQQMQDHQQRNVNEDVKANLPDQEASRPQLRLRPLPTPLQSGIEEPFRLFLRPLPTPVQSPVYIEKRSIPPATSAELTPISAFPKVPVPTPIATYSHSTATITRTGTHSFKILPPTPSPLFPRDLKSLFLLESDKNDWFIKGAEQSPITSVEPRRIFSSRVSWGIMPESPIVEQDACSLDVDSQGHQRDTPIVHTTTPILMIPANTITGRPQLHLIIPTSQG